MNRLPDGKTRTLPSTITTMWMEPTLSCPADDTHKLAGSTRLVYCHDCGVYWVRDGWKPH